MDIAYYSVDGDTRLFRDVDMLFVVDDDYSLVVLCMLIFFMFKNLLLKSTVFVDLLSLCINISMNNYLGIMNKYV